MVFVMHATGVFCVQMRKTDQTRIVVAQVQQSAVWKTHAARDNILFRTLRADGRGEEERDVSIGRDGVSSKSTTLQSSAVSNTDSHLHNVPDP